MRLIGLWHVVRPNPIQLNFEYNSINPTNLTMEEESGIGLVNILD